MKFYHGTTEDNWNKIKEEGILYGGYTFHKTNGKEGYRYTYLTPDIEMAKKYGNILLEVEYNPIGVGNLINSKTIDNYGLNPPPGEECWQFSVFIPINIDKVKVIGE